MRSRDGDRRKCELCKTPTVFRYEVRGVRGGHIRWVDLCPACGEDPEKTRQLRKAA